MGRVFSSMVKTPVKNFNIENRAHKVLDKKPTVAPKHPTTTEAIGKFEKDHPELLEATKEKNMELNEMLKGVMVNPDRMGEIKTRKLPENRQARPDFEFGFPEPDPSKIPVGYLSISQAIKMITDHRLDPEANSVAVLSKQYKLDKEKVKIILDSFHSFMLQMPEKYKKKLDSGETSNELNAVKSIQDGTDKKSS